MPDPASTTTVTRAQLPFLLAAERRDESGDLVGLDFLPMPASVRLDKRIRNDVKRGVKAELEEGKNAKIYNDRTLCVVQVGPTFRFKAAVKEEIVRKVTIVEVEVEGKPAGAKADAKE